MRFMIIRHHNEMLRSGPTGLGILTGCRGQEMLHGETYEAELACFQVDPTNRQRKFDDCPNHRNSHVILIAVFAAGPASHNGGTTCSSC
jgi:hypothetical protein